MKKLIAILLLIPTLAFAESAYVAAQPIDEPDGSTCKVLVSQYRPGSGVMYLGTCGWLGLKGIASYVQGWNFGNHIRVVRGEFDSGKSINRVKVTYIDKVNRIVVTSQEDEFYSYNRRQYNFDDIIADAIQANLPLSNNIMSYVKLANYIDMRE